MIGNRHRPASGLYSASGNRRQALVPAAGIALIEGHGPGAWAVGSERGLQKLTAAQTNGRDLAAQVGQDRHRTIPGLNENVFFYADNRTRH